MRTHIYNNNTNNNNNTNSNVNNIFSPYFFGSFNVRWYLAKLPPNTKLKTIVKKDQHIFQNRLYEFMFKIYLKYCQKLDFKGSPKIELYYIKPKNQHISIKGRHLIIKKKTLLTSFYY